MAQIFIEHFETDSETVKIQDELFGRFARVIDAGPQRLDAFILCVIDEVSRQYLKQTIPFENGTAAIAPLACGAVAVGLIAIGTMAVGVITDGVLSLGVYSAGLLPSVGP